MVVPANVCRQLGLSIAAALVAAFAAAALAQNVGSADAAPAATLQAIQERMEADPQMMSAVQALRDNPQVRDVLDDPDIAAALSRGDVAALLANPKIKRLAEDPAVQGVTRQVTK